MGAACGTLSCQGNSHKKKKDANIIRRPQKIDFSLDDDDIGDDQQADSRLIAPPDLEQTRIGVFF